jgi:Bacterial CdiA-CT RNAse A domain
LQIGLRQSLMCYFGVGIAIAVISMSFGCSHNSVPETSRQPELRSFAPTDNHNSERYDLEEDESLGGHTLYRHVGRTDEQLATRLRREPNISAASTWTDREIAERTVAAALAADRGRIENWMRRGELGFAGFFWRLSERGFCSGIRLGGGGFARILVRRQQRRNSKCKRIMVALPRHTKGSPIYRNASCTMPARSRLAAS